MDAELTNRSRDAINAATSRAVSGGHADLTPAQEFLPPGYDPAHFDLDWTNQRLSDPVNHLVARPAVTIPLPIRWMSRVTSRSPASVFPRTECHFTWRSIS